MRADVDASLSVDEHIAATALVPAPEVTPARRRAPGRHRVRRRGVPHRSRRGLDGRSGPDEFDTDALSEAHAVLSKYLRPGTTTPLLKYDLDALARQAKGAMGTCAPTRRRRSP